MGSLIYTRRDGVRTTGFSFVVFQYINILCWTACVFEWVDRDHGTAMTWYNSKPTTVLVWMWTNGRMNGRTDGRTDGRMDEWPGRVNRIKKNGISALRYALNGRNWKFEYMTEANALTAGFIKRAEENSGAIWDGFLSTSAVCWQTILVSIIMNFSSTYFVLI